MKSMTKLMVVAMVLAAALVVAPAAARTVGVGTVDGNTVYNISPGDTIYVGEKNLAFNQSESWGVLTGGRLVHFTDTTANTTDKNIVISDATNFEVDSGKFGTVTGDYYVFRPGATIGYGNQAGTVFVDIPSVTLDVVLNKSRVDSVNGKTVTRDTKLDFKLDNNLDGFKGLTGVNQPTMKIEVTLPGGGVTTEFGGVTLSGIPVDGTTQNKVNVTLDKAEAGTYTAQAKWPSTGAGASFYNKGYDSKAVTFEVLTKTLAISANKDAVVRDNSFTVTITGESKQKYFMFVKSANLKENQYPLIAPGQNGVSNATWDVYAANKADGLFNAFSTDNVPGLNYTQAWVETNAAGTRSIQFNTSSFTDDRQFTIRVQDLKDKGTYDEVKVKVEKGEVTVTASGTGVYYIGEEITLSGTNTDSKYVYLFLTGPNLGTNGVKLDDTTVKTKTGGGTTNFTRVSVETDDTWSYKWDTSSLGQVIDAGGYTVYAVATDVTKDDLGDNKYDTVGVTLKSAFITATSSGATIAKGDKLTISGTAQGNPSSVNVWIFGKNHRELAKSASVESDGSFEYKLESGQTKDLTAGQYFVVVQHPMYDDFGVVAVGTILQGKTPNMGITSVDLSKLQASDAATALVNALDSPNVDDTYTKLTFVVEEPNIFIDPIGDKEAGSKFTISGTTNLAVGDKLIIDVTSAAFQPGTKTEASGFSSSSGSAVVQKGDGANKWSFEVDATSFKPDQYIVKVESIETTTTATATFNVVAGEVTTQPTGNVTTAPTGAETATTTATTTTAATPTTTPGFGALVALAGLGAVAFLVLRRK